MLISPADPALNLDNINDLDDLSLNEINWFEITATIDLDNKSLMQNIITNILIYNDFYNNVACQLKALSLLTENNYQNYKLNKYHKPNIELE